MRDQLVDAAVGFVFGFVVAQLNQRRDQLLPFFVTLVLVLAPDAAAAGEQTTFRDANGRVTGRAATDSQGSTTFYDSSGRTTGRASTDSQGNTTFYDPSGRNVGRATAPGKR
jgi:YD repeat-containing protein